MSRSTAIQGELTPEQIDAILNQPPPHMVFPSIHGWLLEALAEREATSRAKLLNSLTDVQRNWMYIVRLWNEVQNGGLDQYFINPSGGEVSEAIHALEEVGANRLAEIVRPAQSIFPEGRAPRDWETRVAQVVQAGAGGKALLEELTGQFYNYPDDLEELLINYVRDHQDQFFTVETQTR